jgi:curved DNA-binding protein CbpA
LRAKPADVQSLVTGNALPELYARRVLYLLAITKAIAPVAGAPAEAAEPAAPAEPAIPVDPKARAAAPAEGAKRSLAPAPLRSAAPPAMSTPPGAGPVSLTPPMTSVAPGAGGKESLHSRLDRLQSIPPPPAEIGDELKQRWQRVVAKGRLIENQNYFEMLELDKDAKSSDARSKFYALAKEWHPDRLPAELQPLREFVQIIFSYMSEANATLGDENQRVKYLQTIREGGGTPATDRLMQAILDTAMEYERVLVMARKHQYDEAIEVMKRILAVMKDDAEYQAMYAWLLMQKFPGSGAEAPLGKMLEAVDKALSLHENHERANLLKAQILRRLGRNDEAFEYFQRVAEINPRNIDAMREVRVANMRASAAKASGKPVPGKGGGKKKGGKGKAPEPTGVGGLLGKLFKKD